jgi:hypothetical protein
MSNFMKSFPVGAELSHATDGRTDMTKLVVAFRNFANTPKKNYFLQEVSGVMEEETSAHILCDCEALASLRHALLGSFLEPKDIQSISLGAIRSFGNASGLP